MVTPFITFFKSSSCYALTNCVIPTINACGHIEKETRQQFMKQMFNRDLKKINEMNTIVMHGDLISCVLYRIIQFFLNSV